jgi:hypothetical protein
MRNFPIFSLPQMMRVPNDDQANPLAQFSDAIAARVEAATTAVVAIYLAHERHITGMVCSSDVVVTSEQSLPRHDEFEDCRRRLRTLARNASVANDPKRKSRPGE